ncbi:MAG: hypothetical protein IKW09_01645 [Alphaproteobacteria bacterium]|nr:hypothetical protein [Alphaproteobacteria bacterium]
MKTLILTLTILTFAPHIAYAACTANAKVYSSCNIGYYMSGTTCTKCLLGTYGGGGTATSCSPCPSHAGGASSASGSDAATDCYVSSNKSWSFSDTTGSGNEKFTSTCYYSN